MPFKFVDNVDATLKNASKQSWALAVILNL